MNVSEIFIAVGLTVLAAAVIAYTTFRLQAWHRERILFRALKAEVELNKVKLKNFIKEWKRYYFEKRIYCPEAPMMFTESYEALRLSGELLKLNETVRNRLSYTISLIAVHNRRMSEAGLDYTLVKGIEENEHRMGIILKNLKALENEIDKESEKFTDRIGYALRKLYKRLLSKGGSKFYAKG